MSLPTTVPDAFWGRLREVLLVARGFDLHAYKENLVRRRVASRLRERRPADLESYLRLLASDPEEVQGLLDTLAINVSEFARNPELFEFLMRSVLPDLLARRGPHSVRILSAGCSAGEEPYSLALYLKERYPKELEGGVFQIWGIDLDQEALDRAAAAVYPERSLEGLPEALRRRHFDRREDGWRLKDAIRRCVQFYRRDLLQDRLPGQMDLLLCRNMLIYLSRADQDRLIGRFERALAPGGYLALGRAEVLLARSGAARAFEAVDLRERVYRKVHRLAGSPIPREVHR